MHPQMVLRDGSSRESVVVVEEEAGTDVLRTAPTPSDSQSSLVSAAGSGAGSSRSGTAVEEATTDVSRPAPTDPQGSQHSPVSASGSGEDSSSSGTFLWDDEANEGLTPGNAGFGLSAVRMRSAEHELGSRPGDQTGTFG